MVADTFGPSAALAGGVAGFVLSFAPRTRTPQA